jgi:Protein of unknown function (DUF3788)
MFDPSHAPERNTLNPYLGDAASLWDAVIRSARQRAPQLVETWHFAGAKVGWSLRLVEKARILVYLTPEAGRFRVGLVLGGKAVSAARASGLSAAADSIVDAAPKYAEGHGVRFHVASKQDLAPVDELLGIKFSAAPKPSPRSKRT